MIYLLSLLLQTDTLSQPNIRPRIISPLFHPLEVDQSVYLHACYMQVTNLDYATVTDLFKYLNVLGGIFLELR